MVRQTSGPEGTNDIKSSSSTNPASACITTMIASMSGGNMRHAWPSPALAPFAGPTPGVIISLATTVTSQKHWRLLLPPIFKGSLGPYTNRTMPNRMWHASPEASLMTTISHCFLGLRIHLISLLSKTCGPWLDDDWPAAGHPWIQWLNFGHTSKQRVGEPPPPPTQRDNQSLLLSMPPILVLLGVAILMVIRVEKGDPFALKYTRSYQECQPFKNKNTLHERGCPQEHAQTSVPSNSAVGSPARLTRGRGGGGGGVKWRRSRGDGSYHHSHSKPILNPAERGASEKRMTRPKFSLNEYDFPASHEQILGSPSLRGQRRGRGAFMCSPGGHPVLYGQWNPNFAKSCICEALFVPGSHAIFGNVVTGVYSNCSAAFLGRKKEKKNGSIIPNSLTPDNTVACPLRRVSNAGLSPPDRIDLLLMDLSGGGWETGNVLPPLPTPKNSSQSKKAIVLALVIPICQNQCYFTHKHQHSTVVEMYQALNQPTILSFTFKSFGSRISNGCMSKQILMELHTSIAIVIVIYHKTNCWLRKLNIILLQ
ncbi:hypothetical protein PR048_007896 [Dryococelus australis]|uniref:Uncharacterized protein n=1 Tax=Dryococelus australis TaxID=614101 RepID=A0ABQ9HVK0_9NEOP|nr:hypothetical protein PR048_007896 [Dryococelus australis]